MLESQLAHLHAEGEGKKALKCVFARKRAAKPPKQAAKSSASTKSDGPWLRSCCVLTRLVEGWQRKMRLAPTKEAAMWHIE